MSNESLARSIKAGVIGPDDWLWHDRLGQWTVAGAIDFLWPDQTRCGAGESTTPHATPTGARNDGRSPGPPETPSLTALYLKRRKAKPGTRVAAAASGDQDLVDHLAAAASTATAPDGEQEAPAAAPTVSARNYLAASGPAQKPRDVLGGRKPPPLPKAGAPARPTAGNATRPPPLPNT